jgi:hypothetical protein
MKIIIIVMGPNVAKNQGAVYMLCKVDQSIRIAMSMDMDIPMTYTFLD